MEKSICKNIEHIRGAINSIKHIYGPVEIMAVTKNFSFQDILEALKCGVKHIGESRIQEALPKFERLGGDLEGITKHFIGHLQSNKVRHVVENFDLIQSLDTVKLADIISRYSRRIGKVQSCLIEVKVSHESSKTGVGPNDVKNFYRRLLSVPNVLIRGLMTIAPCGDTPEGSRICFKQMYNLFKCIKTFSPGNSKFDILSMGMSGDYKLAVEEGATMLRIGSAIFGRRNY